MAMLGTISFCLFLIVTPVLSFPEPEVPNVGPEVLDKLLEDKNYELFSKLMKIDNVNLVRPSEEQRSLNPMFHKELEFGDILLTPEQTEQARQGIRFEKYGGSKWQNRRVHYAIASHFDPNERNIILDGINQWNEQVPCLQLYPRNNNEADYIMFFSGEGCYSALGRRGGQQSISLQYDGCLYVGTILHEIEHAVGVAHEQNRYDRDDWIEMLWHNIPDDWKSQYEKTNPNDYGLQSSYDYYSIMHYPVNAPETNKPAFRVRQSGIDQQRIGNGKGFTATDLEKLRILYC